MWIAIEILDPSGHAVYYEEPPYEPGKPFPFEQRRYLDGRDVPRVFKSQYRDLSVEVDPSTMWLVPR